MHDAPRIEVLSTGIVYRNHKPYLYSRQAYFPSVVHLGEKEMVAVFVLGSAFEAVDCHTVVARSIDDGESWALEGPLAADAPLPGISDTYRIARVDDGELVAFGARHRRDDPEMGLTNPDNLGFVPTELALYRSTDRGRTWRGPEIIAPPLEGPAFEICSQIVPLSDGRWLAPTSTWKGWDGACPNGMKALALVSYDGGRTWPEYVDVMDGFSRQVVYWEQSLAPLAGNRVISVAWTHDLARGCNLPLSYAISQDGGRSFGPPQSTGIQGETVRVLPLSGRHLLLIFRRTDRPGLWANVTSVQEGWRTLSEVCLWSGPTASTAEQEAPGGAVEKFQTLRFGAPTLVKIPDGDIFLAFWCVEDCVSNIRWLRLKVT